MATSTQRPIGLPTPGKDLRQHTELLRSVKEALEIAQRQRGDSAKSFVRLEELTEVGLADEFGNLIPLTIEQTAKRIRAQMLLRSS